MYFVVRCIDKANSLELRLATRTAHLDYAATFGTKIMVGGPFLGADGTTPIGSMFIIDLPDLAAAQAFATNDPYAKAGLFAETSVTPWRKVIFNPPAA